jgi:hypothetical protein
VPRDDNRYLSPETRACLAIERLAAAMEQLVAEQRRIGNILARRLPCRAPVITEEPSS